MKEEKIEIIGLNYKDDKKNAKPKDRPERKKSKILLL